MKYMFVHQNGSIVRSESLLRIMINKGEINSYEKILNVEEGTHVVCTRSNVLVSKPKDEAKSSGYVEGLCFKVTRLTENGKYPIAWGGHNSNGVYLYHLRLATQKEIEAFNAKEAKQKYNLNGHKYN